MQTIDVVAVAAVAVDVAPVDVVACSSGQGAL
jgi:hypothetical protein